jgi:phage baseplate assembly protein W
MGKKQRFGIKYPFESYNTDETFVDLNDSFENYVKSKLLHVLFTPKGQRIRDPEFGTNLTKFIFEPSDSATFDDLKNELKVDLKKYVPEIDFESITIAPDDGNDNSRIIIVHYSIDNGTEKTITSVGVKI